MNDISFRNRIFIGVLLLWLPSVTVWSSDLLIINARLIDGSGTPAVDGVSIVVSADRIQSVTPGQVDTKGSQVIDAGGRTVMPGLIDRSAYPPDVRNIERRGGSAIPGSEIPVNQR